MKGVFTMKEFISIISSAAIAAGMVSAINVNAADTAEGPSVYFKVKVYENVYDENGILATPQYSELQEAIKKANSFL